MLIDEIYPCMIEAIVENFNKYSCRDYELNQGFVSEKVLRENKRVIDIELFGTSSIHGKILIELDALTENNICNHIMGGADTEYSSDIKDGILTEFANWITASFGSKIADKGEKLANFKMQISDYKQLNEYLIPKETYFQSYNYTNNENTLVISLALWTPNVG